MPQSRISIPPLPHVELCFLGTSSMVASKSRTVSALGLNIAGKWWIFDAGEGTQMQLHKSVINPAHIERIFVTHMHGDHVLGLPGLILTVGCQIGGEVLEIIGPRGLRRFIRMILSQTKSTLLHRKYRVIELHLMDEKSFDEDPTDEFHPAELSGVNVYPDCDGIWLVPTEGLPGDRKEFTVRAAELKHTLFSLGFVIQEDNFPGRMEASKIPKDRLLSAENKEFLKAKGISNPLQLLNELRAGKEVILVDGVIKPSDVVGEERRGRKITILGDTCDSRAITKVAMGSDILIHECTNAYIPEMDVKSSAAEVEARTYIHGHSTPKTAGLFARAVQAKKLVLTHFSHRYSGDDSEKSRRIMSLIVDQVKDHFGSDEVHCAHDLERFVIPTQNESISEHDYVAKGIVAFDFVSKTVDATLTEANNFFNQHERHQNDKNSGHHMKL